MIRCACGNDEWREVYEPVPCGATVAWMAVGSVCTICGLDESDAQEWCEDCGQPAGDCRLCEWCGEHVDDCRCEEDEGV